jgi:hypothetical protein
MSNCQRKRAAEPIPSVHFFLFIDTAPTDPHLTTMTPQDTHLLVLVHGMWGNPGHLAELYRIILETHTDPLLHVLLAETNKEDSA